MKAAVEHDTVPERIEEFGAALDRIRAEVLADRGPADEAYIRRVVWAQSRLEIGGRAALCAAWFPPAWLAGTAMLSASKIVENMELGHNIMHGQWDWLQDPLINSKTWEWDHPAPAEQWKHSHNLVHHTWTNIVGKDRDVGFGFLRLTPEQPWRPWHLAQPLTNAALAAIFDWGVAIYDAEIEQAACGRTPWRRTRGKLAAVARKARRQVLRDHLVFPAFAGPAFPAALAGNLTANLVRNVWAHTVILCGHFPDGVEYYTQEQVRDETSAQEYVRQLTGSANIDGPPLLHLMTGNLSHQIEHHLFPDLPSNRYAQMAPRIRALCAEYDLPYNAASLPKQAGRAWRRVLRMALPVSARTANNPDEVGRRVPALSALLRRRPAKCGDIFGIFGTGIFGTSCCRNAAKRSRGQLRIARIWP